MSGKARPRSGRAQTGALAVLAAGFLVSAGLHGVEVVAALPTLDDGFGNPALAPGRPAATAEPPGVELLIAELRTRRERLDARAAAIEARSQLLEALEARLRQRLEELTKAQRRLESTATLVDDAAGKDVRHLADMYQQMKPKQAGAIFDQMAPSFAAGFLSAMRPDAAALIMANMAPDKAYAVSLLLASRNVGRQPRP